MSLRRIIGGPVLGVRGLCDGFRNGNCLSYGCAAVAVLFALHGEFDGEEMLTLQPPCFVVRAGTVGCFWVRTHGVATMTGLRGYQPHLPLLGQLARRCDTHAALFTLVEFLLDILPCGGSQVVSLTETPKKRHNNHRALRPQSWWTLRGVLGLGLVGVTAPARPFRQHKLLLSIYQCFIFSF